MAKYGSPIVKQLFLVFLIITFLLGLYVYMFIDIRQMIRHMEGMEELSEAKSEAGGEAANEEGEPANNSCPDSIVRSGKLLYLRNSKKEEKAGENPLVFNNLDEYVQYAESKPECPILALSQDYGAPVSNVYQPIPVPFGMEQGGESSGGIIEVADATRDYGYNTNMHAGFDPQGLYVGKYTNLDQLHDSTATSGTASDNPMDTNWGGVLHTQRAVQSGKYDENIVTRVIYPTPRGSTFLPIANPSISPYNGHGILAPIQTKTPKMD